MQLKSIGKGILPLTILATSASSVCANNGDQLTSIVVDEEWNNDYLRSSYEEESYTGLVLRLNLKKWLKMWQANTAFCSFAQQMIDDENFQNIVKQGKIIVPYIIEEIKQHPSPLVWALNFIYNKTISNEGNITIEEACDCG